MANELQAVAQGDALTIYAVIRRRSDNFVWSTSAFVAWVDGDIGNYDIAMTSVGGDLYAGTFPSAITVGTHVRVQYYQRVGGAPTTDDKLLKSDPLTWTGTALSAGGGAVGAIGCVLTDLATVKRQLEITVTTYDDLIQQIINQQSARVHRIIGRSLCAADYVEFVRTHGDACVTLKQWPIIHVVRVAYGAADVIRINYTGSGVRALLSVTEAGVRLTTTSAAGVTVNTLLEFTVYPTLSMMTTAIDGVAGWDAALADPDVDGLSNGLNRMGGISAMSSGVAREVGLGWPDEEMDGYEVEHDSGIVRLRSRWEGSYSGSLQVEYRAGYETIPQDVAEFVTGLAVAIYKSKGTVGNLKSESIGDYSYTVADASVTEEKLAGEHRSVLAPYMTHRVGAGC